MIGYALLGPTSVRFVGLFLTHLEVLQRTVEQVWQVSQGLLGPQLQIRQTLYEDLDGNPCLQ